MKVMTDRNKFNHISAGRKYDRDLIIEHKAKVTKSRQIIKSSINNRKFMPNCAIFWNNDNIMVDGKTVDKSNKLFCQ